MNHKSARCLVCVVCSKKLPPKDSENTDIPRKNAGRLIGDNLQAVLKIFVDNNFSLVNDKYPKSVCLKCYIHSVS